MLLLKKLLILFLTVAMMVTAYFANKYLKKIINPHASFGRFILFMIANLVAIFVLVVLLSLLLFRYKEFFFK